MMRRWLTTFSIVLVSCSFVFAGQPLKQVDEIHVKTFVAPPYPALARLARQEGTVSLLVRIKPDGRVEEIKQVSGPSLLKESVAKAVSQWTFAPLQRRALLRVTVKFSFRPPARNKNAETFVSAKLPTEVEVVTNPAEESGPDSYLPQ